MTMTYDLFKTAKGHTVVRIVSSDDVTADQANKLNADMAAGAKFANLPILALVEPGANFSPEARKAFTSQQGGATNPVAIVVNSAPLRVMLTFIIRISGAAAATRFFSSEAEAQAWLDEKLQAPR